MRLCSFRLGSFLRICSNWRRAGLPLFSCLFFMWYCEGFWGVVQHLCVLRATMFSIFIFLVQTVTLGVAFSLVCFVFWSGSLFVFRQ